jgi:heme-degrading monooxygenase HmoA
VINKAWGMDMIARVLTVTMKKEMLDTAIAEWPAATAQFKGQGLIRGDMLLLDRASCKVMSVTIWESEEKIAKLLASPQLAGTMGRFRTFFADEPVITQYQVAATVRE